MLHSNDVIILIFAQLFSFFSPSSIYIYIWYSNNEGGTFPKSSDQDGFRTRDLTIIKLLGLTPAPKNHARN